jgi:RND family efflux transporter MFP subunit
MNHILRFIALCLVSTILFAGCQPEANTNEKPVRPVKVMKVGEVTSSTGRCWPGRAEATQEVNLSFRVAGPLITFPVEIGDEVKKGDLLARIDPRDFEVNLSNAEAQRAKAIAALQRVQRDYERSERIRKRDAGAVSQKLLDQNREALDRAKAEIKSLEAAVDAAKDLLRYTYLRAPFSGTVVATYVENHEYVQAKQPIIRVLDTSRIEMTVNIPESLIPYVPNVLNIRVRYDAFPGQEISAEIKEIGIEASDITRTYPVTLIMDQPADTKILPGMAGKVSWETPLPEIASETCVEVPTGALFSSEKTKKSCVWVVDQETKRVSRREVETGRLTDFGIMVQDGLKGGEWIVTAGVHYLRDGQRVRVLSHP